MDECKPLPAATLDADSNNVAIRRTPALTALSARTPSTYTIATYAPSSTGAGTVIAYLPVVRA